MLCGNLRAGEYSSGQIETHAILRWRLDTFICSLVSENTGSIRSTNIGLFKLTQHFLHTANSYRLMRRLAVHNIDPCKGISA